MRVYGLADGRIDQTLARHPDQVVSIRRETQGIPESSARGPARIIRMLLRYRLGGVMCQRPRDPTGALCFFRPASWRHVEWRRAGGEGYMLQHSAAWPAAAAHKSVPPERA